MSWSCRESMRWWLRVSFLAKLTQDLYYSGRSSVPVWSDMDPRSFLVSIQGMLGAQASGFWAAWLLRNWQYLLSSLILIWKQATAASPKDPKQSMHSVQPETRCMMRVFIQRYDYLDFLPCLSFINRTSVWCRSKKNCQSS